MQNPPTRSPALVARRTPVIVQEHYFGAPPACVPHYGYHHGYHHDVHHDIHHDVQHDYHRPHHGTSFGFSISN